MNPDIGILDKYIKELGLILAKHGIDQILIFGSRNSGTFRDTSDLDLIVLNPSSIDLKNWALLKIDIEESLIPILIDIQKSSSVSERFLKNIFATGTVWKISPNGNFEKADRPFKN